MARKSTDKTDKPKAERKPKADKPKIETISDEQRQALFIRHKRALAPLLARQAQADADVKQAYALAKAEGVSKASLEFARKLESDEGEAKAKAERAWQDEVARWSGTTLGGQLELFGGKGPNKHFEDGKRAGMAGEPRRPPQQLGAIEDCDQWFAGWDAGVKAYDAISSVGRGAEAKSAFLDTIGG